MRLRASSPRMAAGILAVALLLALAVAWRSAGGGASSERPSPAPIRADPATGPFQGLGVWVDLYDESAWADPAGAVADMAAHGVRTLYLETSNADRSSAFVDESGVSAFLDAAAADGVQVVAWYLPNLQDLSTDASRSEAAIAYSTPAGNRFQGFALDIESAAVRDAALRTRRLLELSASLREAAGDTYPLGAIVPSPRGMQIHAGYWPGFPWTSLAQTYDVILPMTYFTYRTHGEAGARAYASTAVGLVRRWVGNHGVPIHVIGGLAQDATTEETTGFVQAVTERRVIGASYYTWPGITDGQWAALAQVPSG
jgi:hypothetical protein